MRNHVIYGWLTGASNEWLRKRDLGIDNYPEATLMLHLAMYFTVQLKGVPLLPDYSKGE